MILTRVIPCLLLKGRRLVKTIKFKKLVYLGDPVNAVKIFNDKEVDELVLLDITATAEQRKPQIEYIAEIAGECFMPLGYGGGIRDLATVRKLINIGIEKVVINSQAAKEPGFIREVSAEIGSQSLVVSIDVKKNLWGKAEVFTHGGRENTGFDPVEFAQRMEELGAGELLLTSIDRDGTMLGYDLELIRRVTRSVRIPVVASGGAASIQDLAAAVKQGGAAAAAAGSMFVFQGIHRAVLISYPAPKEIRDAFGP